MSARILRRVALDIADCFRAVVRHPVETVRILHRFPAMVAGSARGKNWPGRAMAQQEKPLDPPASNNSNPLAAYFESHQVGRGIFKWEHYFEIYHRYFQKFVGKEVHVVEIGIFSGGSLDMWKSYFGPECRIYGVDIQEACKAYEDEKTKVIIGDQGDRAFWGRFRELVPRVDIVIDDGSHFAEHQIITLEELLPHMQPGGVYLCEDHARVHTAFTAYVYGLADRLNAAAVRADRMAVVPSQFQKLIEAVHLHPYVTVIERRDHAVDSFTCAKRGTEWQPFAPHPEN